MDHQPHLQVLLNPPVEMQPSVVAAQVGLASAARTLQPWTYSPLPVGAVKPGGWLLGEMQAMADGLAGHEHDFYVYVNESSWLNKPGSGGAEYSTLNEGLPYWFNSLVPLAYTLDDDRLKAQVHEVASTVLGHQAPDGWIGPEVGDARSFWARTPLFLGLTQLVEANATWEQPVLDGLGRFMTLTNWMLKNDSQGFAKCAADVDCSWGQARVHDTMITIQWLLERYPSKQDAVLWENMDLFWAQSNFRWDKWYTEGTFQKVSNTTDGSIWPYLHGVNVGQGLKAPSVAYRVNGSHDMVQKSHDAVDWTFKYHGSASGTVLADEGEHHLAPYMGSELCTAVETAYSLAYMYQVLGRNDFADRAERAIFNAFPVMMTGDKWAHQYMAQPNQPHAINTTAQDGHVPPVFTSANSGMATIFGMEPQYPCCTVNHPQGYPKFVSNSWVAVGKTGLGHALLSPSTVTTRVNGGAVTIACDTAYPFEDELQYTIEAEKAFDLFLRVPDWARSSSTSQPSTMDSKTSMRKVHVKAGKTKLKYMLDAQIRTEARSNNTVAVFHGSLLYALELSTTQTSSYPHAWSDTKGPGLGNLPFPQLRDYYIDSTSAWNVAIDPSTLKYHGSRGGLRNPIFAQGAPSNYMTVDGCEIEWPLYLGVTPDWAPVDRTCKGRRTSYRLIPYGAAKVHMSDLPVMKFH